ncbi:MAG: carboxylating nicotinate-nucleotide diphosphorylase [Desulfitobacteriaceae bacterium]
MLVTFQLQAIIDRALEEDLGTGDLSAQILPEGLVGQAKLYSKGTAIVAGIELVKQVFQRVDTRITVKVLINDGENVFPGSIVMELSGPLASILMAERTALNFIQHLSGVATATREAVELVNGLPVRIADTRKTLAGLRALQKYAVQVGGGFNHRYGLYDAVLLKDNHLTSLGGLTTAVELARQKIGHMVKLEVECESLAQVQEALACGVDVIMLDNMTTEQMREAVVFVNHRVIVEASGGIKAGNIRAVAETGVDIISLGALTHSVKSMDFSLDVGDIKLATRQRIQSDRSEAETQ